MRFRQQGKADFAVFSANHRRTAKVLPLSLARLPHAIFWL
jgi:hypothetical protein